MDLFIVLCRSLLKKGKEEDYKFQLSQTKLNNLFIANFGLYIVSLLYWIQHQTEALVIRYKKASSEMIQQNVLFDDDVTDNITDFPHWT